MRISDWSSDVCSSDLAASLILSSADRTVSVQGVAGAGKSTMLQAVARVAEAEGRTITGLAFQNKMVADVAEGAGITAQTIASFVLAHERYIAERSTPRYETARARKPAGSGRCGVSTCRHRMS